MPTRLLPPQTRLLSEPPRSEVTTEAGDVIGWIEEHYLTGGNTFYFATAPREGAVVRLEGSKDFQERVSAVERFHEDPLSARQHLPRTVAPAASWGFGDGKPGRHG